MGREGRRPPSAVTAEASARPGGALELDMPSELPQTEVRGRALYSHISQSLDTGSPHRRHKLRKGASRVPTEFPGKKAGIFPAPMGIMAMMVNFRHQLVWIKGYIDGWESIISGCV